MKSRNKKSCIFYVVRHAQSKSNIGHFFHANPCLTSKGEDQAKKLGTVLKDVPFDAVFSSDLHRAKHTAKIIIQKRNLVLQTHKSLRERRSVDLLIEKFYRGTLNNAVTPFILTLREIAKEYSGKKVLVVSHGFIMRSFLVSIKFATFNDLPFGSIDNTGFFKLSSDGVNFSVLETVGVNKR